MNTKENQEKWVEKVIANLELKGRSEETKENYRYSIKKFLNYYKEDADISKLTEDDIIKYFKTEYLDKKRTSSTYNFNLSPIRVLFSVCFRKVLDKNLLPNSKVQHKLPTIITKKDFLMIFNSEKNIEHKCWLLLSFCCGLRCIDISNLKIEYVHPKEHKLKVHGKGGKERYTILPDIVTKYLRLYCLKTNIKDKTGYLFPGTKGRINISPGTIGNYFTNYMKNFDLKDITEHSLRHSFATYYLMNGGDLIVLKEMLGHKNLISTLIYVHLSHDFNNLKGINYGRDKK